MDIQRSYNTPSFAAKLSLHGSVLNDKNFRISKSELAELKKFVKNIGTSDDEVILSATKSQKVSEDFAPYDLFERKANVTSIIGENIKSRTFSQTKVSTEYDDAKWWGSSDVERNRYTAETCFRSNSFAAFKNTILKMLEIDKD
ncbi:hypothetical protein IJZ97_02815 [bacterium]|nr:hypothetical protein [bacterium]